MNAAASARKRKEMYPDMYCPVCLWRVVSNAGRTPCPTHMQAEIDASLADSESLVPLLQASIAIAKGEAQ